VEEPLIDYRIPQSATQRSRQYTVEKIKMLRKQHAQLRREEHPETLGKRSTICRIELELLDFDFDVARKEDQKRKSASQAESTRKKKPKH